MNIFIIFFLTTSVVNAAPHAASISGKHRQRSGYPVNYEYEEKKYLLKSIINSVKTLNTTLKQEILEKSVQHIFMNNECSCETLCKAAKVLSVYKISDLGLQELRDWKLPRMLLAYTKSKCTTADEPETHLIPFHQLLDEIKRCAQEQHTNL